MKNNKTLKIIGAITLLIIISTYADGAWAGITLNSTNDADTLKLLKILPSSGETVNVSGMIINVSNGDIIKIGKFTQDIKIEKVSPQYRMKATDDSNQWIRFENTTDIVGYFGYEASTDTYTFGDKGSTPKVRIDVLSGNITKVGTILPADDNVQDLGSDAKSWKNGWIQNAFTVGHLVFGYNNWSLFEAEKYYPDNPNAKGMLWVNGNNETVAWLDDNGGFHLKGSIEEFWDGEFK